MKKILVSILVLFFALFLKAEDGSITNVEVEQRPDGSGLFDVYFDLNGEGTNYFIRLEVSFNAGANYSSINSVYISGDVGPINPGNNKHVVWDGLNSHPHEFSEEAKIKVTAASGVFVNTGEPCLGIETVEYEGIVYNTVQIGDQCWLKENLNVGVMITAGINQSNNDILEKYCYNNDEFYCNVYGGLYQWNEAMQYSTEPGAQGICPPGWHIPTDDEWKILEGYVDSQYGIGNPVWDEEDYRGFDVGKLLKSVEGWLFTGNGTDYFGFAALPAGIWNKIHTSASFTDKGRKTSFWSSNYDGSTTWAYHRRLQHNSDQSARSPGWSEGAGVNFRRYYGSGSGQSVRCIKSD